MPYREYEITIAGDGTVEVLISGFKGNGCLQAAKMFEELIGKIESQQPTHEFYEPDEEVRIDLNQHL